MSILLRSTPCWFYALGYIWSPSNAMQCNASYNKKPIINVPWGIVWFYIPKRYHPLQVVEGHKDAFSNILLQATMLRLLAHCLSKHRFPSIQLGNKMGRRGPWQMWFIVNHAEWTNYTTLLKNGMQLKLHIIIEPWYTFKGKPIYVNNTLCYSHLFHSSNGVHFMKLP